MCQSTELNLRSKTEDTPINKITYNYKIHVDKIVDGHTVGGLVDMGFREFKYRHVQIAAIDLPDPKRLKHYSAPVVKANGAVRKNTWEGMTKDDAKAYSESCYKVLQKLLFYEEGGTHGRTIVMSPESPNYYGRSLAHLYVVTANTSFEAPQLIRSYSGLSFLSVSRFVHYAADHKFDDAFIDSTITSLELRDFKL